jgi:hypothetical protein
VYDPGTDTWTKKANFGGTARSEATGFSIGNKGYIGIGQRRNEGTNDFWEFDPGTNTWIQKADFGGGPRHFAVGISIGNRGYIGTGVYPYYKDFWEYTPDISCASPSNLKVPKISDTSATLKWQVAGPEILHVRVRYRVMGGTTWTIKNKQGDKPTIHIDGLTPNTTYKWQTRSFCAEDTSGWVAGPDFTTAASLNPGAKATAYPNPATNTVTVNYAAIGNGKYIFEITNASGNVVLRKEANAIPGANHITLDISRFFKGVYFISIIKPDMTRERIQLSKE